MYLAPVDVLISKTPCSFTSHNLSAYREALWLQQNRSLGSPGDKRTYANNIVKQSNATIAPNDFLRIGMLGRGNVGHVYLVRKRWSSHLTAMKVLSKKCMIKRKKVDQAPMDHWWDRTIHSWWHFTIQIRPTHIYEFACNIVEVAKFLKARLGSFLIERNTLNLTRALIFSAQLSKRNIENVCQMQMLVSMRQRWFWHWRPCT
jgi:hypothetical protein